MKARVMRRVMRKKMRKKTTMERRKRAKTPQKQAQKILLFIDRLILSRSSVGHLDSLDTHVLWTILTYIYNTKHLSASDVKTSPFPLSPCMGRIQPPVFLHHENFQLLFISVCQPPSSSPRPSPGPSPSHSISSSYSPHSPAKPAPSPRTARPSLCPTRCAGNPP